MSSNQPTPHCSKSSFLDFLKPRYHEAVFRLRNSLLALVALLTLTHLLPLPTPYASAWKFYRDSFQSSWEKTVAIAELLLFGLLLLNILQASFAIRSPPAPYPPMPSPLKQPLSPPPSRSKHLTATASPPNWRSNKKSSVLSPNTTPQRQLAFSTIATTSTTSSSAGGGVSGVAVVGAASSDPRGLAQSYTLTLNHNLASSSPTSPDLSFGSSTGSLPPSPSPAQVVSPIAAYRGRRPLTGRALDGSLLARLSQVDSDSDVDE